MTFGLTKNELQYIRDTIVQPLQELNAVIYCFGSRARNDHQRGSDLDLMVVSERDLEKEISLMREVVEESNFPYQVEIVEEAKFSTSYLENYKQERVAF